MKDFKSLLCKYLRAKQSDPEFLVQIGQIKCKISHLLYIRTKKNFDLEIALGACKNEILSKYI